MKKWYIWSSMLCFLWLILGGFITSLIFDKIDSFLITFDLIWILIWIIFEDNILSKYYKD